MPPLVSIVVATYNAAQTLDDCLKSITDQTFRDFEIVIVDGKSKDGTVEIIKKYELVIGHWVSEKDNGIYDAMNKGIKASKGEWILFLGADDKIYNENVFHDVFVRNAPEANVDFVYGETLLKSNGKILGGKRDYHRLVEQNISHQAIFYRRRLFDVFGLYKATYKVLADYDLNLRIFENESIVKKFVPVVISLFNDKGTSNVAIDKNFFRDQLAYLLAKEQYSPNSAPLQKYFFFRGFSNILQRRWRPGVIDVFHSLLHGRKKLYYFLVAGKFFLSMMGIGKKINSY